MNKYEFIHRILHEWSQELQVPQEAVEKQRKRLIKIFENEEKRKCIVENAEKRYRIIL